MNGNQSRKIVEMLLKSNLGHRGEPIAVSLAGENSYETCSN